MYPMSTKEVSTAVTSEEPCLTLHDPSLFLPSPVVTAFLNLVIYIPMDAVFLCVSVCVSNAFKHYIDINGITLYVSFCHLCLF